MHYYHSLFEKNQSKLTNWNRFSTAILFFKKDRAYWIKYSYMYGISHQHSIDSLIFLSARFHTVCREIFAPFNFYCLRQRAISKGSFLTNANWIYFSFILTVIVANHGQYICTILSHLEVADSKLWLETIPGSVRANLKRVKLFTNGSENYSATKKTS